MWKHETKIYDTRIGFSVGTVADFLQYCFDRNYLDGKRRLQHLPFLPIALIVAVSPEKGDGGRYTLD